MRIFRAIIIGALTGAALFFLPFFILRGFLFILFIGIILRVFAFGRWRGGYRRGEFNPLFADKIRSMSDDEYNRFKQHFYNSCGGRRSWNNNQPAAETNVD